MAASTEFGQQTVVGLLNRRRDTMRRWIAGLPLFEIARCGGGPMLKELGATITWNNRAQLSLYFSHSAPRFPRRQSPH